MTDDQTLLGFIARWHNIGLEDAATDALCFILSRSRIALATVADFLGDGHAPCRSRVPNLGWPMNTEPYPIWRASTPAVTWWR